MVQLKKCITKGCQLYATKIEEIQFETPKTILEQYPILKDFQEVFLDEIQRFSPKRYLEFTIDPMPGSAPIS